MGRIHSTIQDVQSRIRNRRSKQVTGTQSAGTSSQKATMPHGYGSGGGLGHVQKHYLGKKRGGGLFRRGRFSPENIQKAFQMVAKGRARHTGGATGR